MLITGLQLEQERLGARLRALAPCVLLGQLSRQLALLAGLPVAPAPLARRIPAPHCSAPGTSQNAEFSKALNQQQTSGAFS